jgi:hypothetical protein
VDKSGEAVDFQEANPLISTHKAFSRSQIDEGNDEDFGVAEYDLGVTILYTW